jgi:hypothetical protein
MGKIREIDGLQIDENLPLQHRIWAVQRFGWTAMVLLGGAAVTGALGGPGLLSSATAGEKDSGLWVQYERFARLRAPADIAVNLRPENGEVSFTVDASLLESIHIRSICPQPLRIEAGEGVHRFIFPQAAESGGSIKVILRTEAERWGRVHGRVRAGGLEVELSRFVYP